MIENFLSDMENARMNIKRWTRTIWDWLNAPRPFPIVELTPTAESGALRIEAPDSMARFKEFWVPQPDGSIHYVKYLFHDDGMRIVDQKAYTRENCPVVLIQTPYGWQAQKKAGNL